MLCARKVQREKEMDRMSASVGDWGEVRKFRNIINWPLLYLLFFVQIRGMRGNRSFIISPHRYGVPPLYHFLVYATLTNIRKIAWYFRFISSIIIIIFLMNFFNIFWFLHKSYKLSHGPNLLFDVTRTYFLDEYLVWLSILWFSFNL